MMKVRASPQRISFIKQHFPDAQIGTLSDGSYSVQNLEGTRLIALLKENGLVLEQQDALLIIKDVKQAANTVVAEQSEQTPNPLSQATTNETEAPKTAVYEHLDQAFTGIIQGMLAPKFTVLESKISEIAKAVQTLSDRYDVGKTQLELSIQNAERQSKDTVGKMSDEAQKVKSEVEARLAKFKTEMETEINTLDTSLQKVDTELKQCVASQETHNNASQIVTQTNLEEHKKMQENLDRIVKHFKDIPLPK